MSNRIGLTLTGVVLVVLAGVALHEFFAHMQPFNTMTVFQEQSSTVQAPNGADPTVTATLQPTVYSTAVSTADWKIYTDSGYEFSIYYPPTMQLENSKQVADNHGFDWIPLCNYEYPNIIICFYLPPGTYSGTTNTDFTGASLAISTINLNQQDCLSFSDFRPMIGAPKSNIINGINLSTIKTSGGGTGHGRFDIHNRTFVHNACFDLTSTTAITLYAELTVWTSTPTIKPFTDADGQVVQAIFDQMLSTFSFTSSEQPTLSVYRAFINGNGWNFPTNSPS